MLAPGNRVLHQVPSGSIMPSRVPSALTAPLFSFSAVTQYLIPTQQFCDRLLTFCVNHHRVIGYPVCIREGRYSRNEFIFNFAIVIGENEADWACYGEVVRKLGRLLRGLEEQGGFLSNEETGVWEDDGSAAAAASLDAAVGGPASAAGSKVYALCEMVLEDLNNYAECMIPIDDSNTINLKLFPTRPPPPPILAHQVPVLTISLTSLQTPISSDLTLNRILPFVNGVHSISHIAQLADTDLSLTRRAVQHLVYYGCLVLLDVFSFSAIYAPTAEIGGFVEDADVKDECIRYIMAPRTRLASTTRTVTLESGSDTSRDDQASVSDSARQPSDPQSASSEVNEVDNGNSMQKTYEKEPEWQIDHETLITLYTSLRQGLALKVWVLENMHLLSGIDVRRFITFGIIKGFLYRVHKYAIAASTALPPAPPTSLQTSAAPSVAHAQGSDTATIRGGNVQHVFQSTAHGHPQHPSFSLHRPSIASTTSLRPQAGNLQHTQAAKPEVVDGASSERERESGLPLLRFLDGMHCFDEICSDLGLPEKVVEGKVKSIGDGLGVIIHR